MKGLDRVGAITLVVVAAGYLIASLITGHSAASNPPADLAATERGLDVFKAIALLLDHQGQVAIVDTRPRAKFRAYHLAGATNLPDATPRQVLRALGERRVALVVATSDVAAEHLVAEALAIDAQRQLHFVQGGAQAIYLTFELPVEVFAERDAPFGYAESVATVRQFLRSGKTERPAEVRRAMTRLTSLDYAPTQLAGKKAPSAKKKRKISGGCG